MEEEWQKQLRNSITSPEELSMYFDIDPGKLRKVTQKFPICITPYYLSLIKEKDDPIYKQAVPDEQDSQR